MFARRTTRPLLDAWYSFGKNTLDAAPNWKGVEEGFPVGLRHRFPKQTAIRRVMANGAGIPPAQCRIWTDDRFQYLQVGPPPQGRFLCLGVAYE